MIIMHDYSELVSYANILMLPSNGRIHKRGFHKLELSVSTSATKHMFK